MSQSLDADALGPVDIAVIGIAGDAPSPGVVDALLDLQNAGTVHVIDLAIVAKDVDGETSYVEVESEAVANLADLDDELDLLNDEDLSGLAEQLEPGSSALVVVWENTWAAKLAAQIRDQDGELLLNERIPHEAVAAAIAALDED
jgi:uncharacterized membrane protein